ncbi:MAG: hypothetical protein ACRD2S_07805 [Terriglobales bacterium]
MKNALCKILPALAIALVIAVTSGIASAQSTGEEEAFTTNYFSNNTTAGAPDATLRFTENGSGVQTASIINGAPDGIASEDECAMIYVYAADQQLTTCCGCPVSANGLIHESVKTDLTSNYLTRVEPNEGVIQIVSGIDLGVCDPTNVLVSPEIESWLTHVQNKVGTAFPITEGRGDEELLSDNELGTLEGDCASAIRLGSGYGVCSCNVEAVK